MSATVGNVRQRANGVRKGPTEVPPLYQRIFTAKSDWPDKEEFLDVVFWLRQLFAVIMGIVWGVLPLKGIIGIVLFCMVNTALVYIYASYFQQVDEEDFGDSWEFAKEGFMTTFAGFLVSWIIVYTGLHTEDSSLA